MLKGIPIWRQIRAFEQVLEAAIDATSVKDALYFGERRRQRLSDEIRGQITPKIKIAPGRHRDKGAAVFPILRKLFPIIAPSPVRKIFPALAHPKRMRFDGSA